MENERLTLYSPLAAWDKGGVAPLRYLTLHGPRRWRSIWELCSHRRGRSEASIRFQSFLSFFFIYFVLYLYLFIIFETTNLLFFYFNLNEFLSFLLFYFCLFSHFFFFLATGRPLKSQTMELWHSMCVDQKDLEAIIGVVGFDGHATTT